MYMSILFIWAQFHVSAYCQILRLWKIEQCALYSAVSAGFFGGKHSHEIGPSFFLYLGFSSYMYTVHLMLVLIN